MATLVVIPARGGSTRIPRKNIRPFVGVPLIARTIDVVLASGVGDRVVVSTDDDEIAAVARSAGADVPFVRDAGLADDHTPTMPVVADAVERVAADDGTRFETTWAIYPTAVLLRPGDLASAAEAFARSAATVAMSVVASRAPVERAWRMVEGGHGRMAWPEHAGTRTQDLLPAYFDAGQFYVADTDFWRSATDLGGAEPLLVTVPPWRAVDIDTADDWRLAEALFRAASAG